MPRQYAGKLLISGRLMRWCRKRRTGLVPSLGVCTTLEHTPSDRRCDRHTI